MLSQVQTTSEEGGRIRLAAASSIFSSKKPHPTVSGAGRGGSTDLRSGAVSPSSPVQRERERGGGA